MKTSAAGKSFIEEFEECRLIAYQDGGGVWTIGKGHTGKHIGKGVCWSQELADATFEHDIAVVEAGVNSLVIVPLTQNQFDALVSFAFNVGLDIDEDDKAEGLGDSTLLKKLNRCDYAGAALEFLKWNHDNGKVVKGLTRRRMAEKLIFETQ